MIFNPLFLSENTGSQIMAPKTTKMSNNKYLFSDIVKVVMAPVDEQKENAKNTNSIIGSNVGLVLDKDQNPVQLEQKYLSELDSESAKMGLIEMLPIEIAQLLVKDETEKSEEKAVSYISQEPLAGELQNFVNNLIGTEIIESHISDKSGLLLSLEDSKSAVNLELAQGSGDKSVADKITVQTLVVPEKSKLLSLMGDVQSKKGLFRIDNSQIQNLNNLSESVSKSNGILGDLRPTLSVYSFNYVGNNPEANVNPEQNLKNNLNLLKSQNANSINIQDNKLPSNKGSFVPSEIKNAQPTPVGIMNESQSELKSTMSDLKLLRSEAVNIPKDYSVSKITIVKKQSDAANQVKIQADENVSNAKINSGLKRIDFGNTLNSKNITIQNITSQNTENNTKNMTEQVGQKLLNNIETQNVNKAEVKHNLLSNVKESVIENNKINNQETKTSQTENIAKPNVTKTNNINVNKIISESTQQNTEKTQNINNLNSDVKIDNNKNTEAQLVNKEIIVNNEKISSNTLVDSNEVKENGGEKVSKNIEASKTDNNAINKTNLRSEIKELNKLDVKLKTQPTVETVEKNIANEEKTNTITGNETQLSANKKISVKVKGGVKSVSEKLDTQVKTSQNIKQNETSSSNNESNKDNSSSNEFKNNPFNSAQFNMKVNTENGFQQFLGENEMAAVESGLKETGKSTVESDSKLKVVKSAEVLKEVTKFISKQEKGSLSFDIKPEHLGKVKITLDTAEHVVRARIEVESEHAKHLIEKNLDKLHQDLAENGVELNSLNISLSNPKHHKEEQELMKNYNTKSENNGQVGETEEEEQKKTLGYNTYEYIA